MDKNNEDKNRKPILTWFRNNQITEKKAVGLTFKCIKNIDTDLKFPLKYVVMTSTPALVSEANFLKFTCDKISFKCFTTSMKWHTYKISLDNILKLRYEPEKHIFNMTLVANFYKTTFPDMVPTQRILENTIWFCLDSSETEQCKCLLDRLLNDFSMKLNLSRITPDSLKLFSETIYKQKKTWENHMGILTYMNIKTSLSQRETDSTTSKETDKGTLVKRKLNRLCLRDPFPGKRSKMNQKEEKLVYCPSPNHSIEILSSDLDCLHEKVYINDNIINLYITYIYYGIMSEEQRQKTYFFNSFFNTKLIGTKNQLKTDTSQIRHDRVAKWTKNVDIFEKDYLIIPVCELNHWFLIIVCFPWMVGMVNYGKLLKSDSMAVIPENNSNFARKKRVDKCKLIRTNEKFEPMPCILIFDSLNVEQRSSKVNIVRDYLQCEWNIKRASTDGPLLFNKNTARGYSPKVPQQLNNSDCGIYLLQYVESFFRCPLKDFSFGFFSQKLITWFDQSEIRQKRKKIREIILSISKKSESLLIDK